LEAVYYLVTGRSFRTRFDRECLPWPDAAPESAPGDTPEDSDSPTPTPPHALPDRYAQIDGHVHRRAANNDLRVVIGSDKKQVLIDGKPLERLGALWGRLNAVLFTPSDLSLVQDGPAARRRFLDTELAQIAPVYLSALQRVDRALPQRNAGLRSQGGLPLAGGDAALERLRKQLVPFEGPLAEGAA